ncbi:MAG TPA: CoA transferase [Candidatus Micrarchaeaceae archaeon]|nr:CoA transferase [Candidatus Micrarchaeaceae archaeon]
MPPGSGFSDPWSEFHDHGKETIELDLWREPESLRALITASDLLIEGTEPGRLAELGLDPARLIDEQPKLVVVSISPFGQTGPYRGYRANDLIVFGMGGVMFISGQPGQPPVTAPDQQAWVTAGTHGALAALSALWAREAGGLGDWVDVSAFECLVAQENTLTNLNGPGDFARRQGSQHRTSLPGRIYRCRDGFVHLFISREEPVWRRFLQWIGEPPELMDPALAEINTRWRHFQLIDSITAEWVGRRTREEIFETAQLIHLPVVPVNTPSDFFDDPQTRFQHAVEIDPKGRRRLRPAAGFTSSE